MSPVGRRPSPLLALVTGIVGLVLGLAALAGATPVAGQAPPAGTGVGPTYRPPVDAAVTDPFRAPPERWAAGNRGIEYATVPGQVVRAIGPGVVVFAGPVAGALHVTVRHPDGLRSSYSFVAVVRVRIGDRVGAGQAVAVAGARLHLGVRRGETYVDPAGLWGRHVGGGRAQLVPDPAPGHRSPRPGGAVAAPFAQVADAVVASLRPW